MNLRDNKNNKKLLEEFNKHSKDMLDIIKKRTTILQEVNVVPGQIWEKADGRRVVVTAVVGPTIHFMSKTGKHAIQIQTQKYDTFESELYIYVGTAGDIFTSDFLGYDGRTVGRSDTDVKAAKKAIKGTIEGLVEEDLTEMPF